MVSFRCAVILGRVFLERGLAQTSARVFPFQVGSHHGEETRSWNTAAKLESVFEHAI